MLVPFFPFLIFFWIVTSTDLNLSLGEEESATFTGGVASVFWWHRCKYQAGTAVPQSFTRVIEISLWDDFVTVEQRSSLPSPPTPHRHQSELWREDATDVARLEEVMDPLELPRMRYDRWWRDKGGVSRRCGRAPHSRRIWGMKGGAGVTAGGGCGGRWEMRRGRER